MQLSSLRAARALAAAALAVGLAASAAAGTSAQAGDNLDRPGFAPLEKRSAPMLGPRTKDGREILSERGSHSRTYLNPDGSLTTSISATPVNFKDGEGSWRPIDNRLVQTSAGTYRNRQNRFTVELPAQAGAAPVEVSGNGHSVSFALRGASARAHVEGAVARYRAALPATTLEYAAVGEGVKETLTLASRAAPTRFVFDLDASGGVVSRKAADGGIDFVDGQGRVQGRFLPAYMIDAAGVTSRGVTMRVARAPGGHTLTLALDRRWLADPKRRFPVVVDPTYVYSGGEKECYLANGASSDTNFCSLGLVKVGFDGQQTSRALLHWSALGEIPRHAVVLDAELTLHLEGASTANPASVSVHRLTRAFSDTTWNRADVGVNWTTPGGDFDPAATSTREGIGGATGVSHQWPIRKLVQGWIDGSFANHGLLVKQQAENVNNVLRFNGTSGGTPSAHWPELRVTWERGIGLWGRYRFVGQELSDRLGLQVNIARGNLIVEEDTLSIAGTGPALSLSRFYNSLSSIGWADWRLNTGSGVFLEETDDRSIAYHGASGFAIPFVRNPDGTYTSPTAINATLLENENVSYKLTYHASGDVENFDASGRLVSEVDANGNRISYAYSGGDLTSITDTQGRVTTLAYDPSCLLVSSITDPSGRVHRYAYDPLMCGVTSYTDPAGKVTRYAHDATGTLIRQITDPRGNVTKLAYDWEKRVTSIVRVTLNGTGPTTTFTYNAGNTVVTDPNGNKTTFHYDEQGRVTSVVDALGRTRSATYSPNSDLLEFTSAAGNKTVNEYNDNNSLTSSKLATGATSRWEYADPNPNNRFYASKATDPQGNEIRFGYDANGNLTSLQNALASQNTARFTYNANGTVATATDFKGTINLGCAPAQVTICYGYDTKGNLTSVNNPAPLGDESYTYDALSRVATATDGKGQQTSYTYDLLDRVTKITYHDGSAITYTYDADGNVTSMIDNTGTTTFTYDALDRLTKETLPGSRTNTYTYDAASNMRSFADAGGTVNYGYNQLNLLTSVTEAGPKQTILTYDVDDMREETRYPNGVTMYFMYDASNRIKRVWAKKVASGTILTDFTYEWKNAVGADTGLRQSVTDKDGSKTSYTYNPLNRLERAEERSSAGTLLNSYSYTYDANSNRTGQTVNGVTTTYSHNDADQLTSAGSTTFTYDGNGNETGNSAGRSFAYNAKDQVVSATPAGGSAIPMSYTGAGQFLRVTAGSTTFQNSELGLTREATTSYTRDDDGLLLGRRTSTTNHYYLLDGLGSVAAVTDASGNVVATYSYEPFGKVQSETGTLQNPYRWLGALGVYFDAATGLYKMGTRYYDPALGRFTQVDPVDGGSLNAYDYAAQDPINVVDPDGRIGFVAVAVVVGARIAAPVAGRLAVRAAYRLLGRKSAPRVTTPVVRGRQARLGAHPAQHGLPPHLQLNWWRVGVKGKPIPLRWDARTGRLIKSKPRKN